MYSTVQTTVFARISRRGLYIGMIASSILRGVQARVCHKASGESKISRIRTGAQESDVAKQVEDLVWQFLTTLVALLHAENRPWKWGNAILSPSDNIHSRCQYSSVPDPLFS